MGSLLEHYVARERWRRRQQLELSHAPDPGPPQQFGRRVPGRRRSKRLVMVSAAATLATVLGAQRAAAESVHRVQPGETLSGIAARYGVSVEAIARVNGLHDPNRILAGSTLTIPQSESHRVLVHRVVAGETPTSIAQRYGVSLRALVDANRLADPDRIYAGQTLVVPLGDTVQWEAREGRRYVVQPGDTLWALARRFGVSLEALAEANAISDPNRLVVGQVLVVPQRVASDAVRLEGVPAYRQALPLSCEAAALSMVTAYWGKPISEWVFIENMPYDPNPHRGFRGRMTGVFGGTDDYGIYAEPLVPLLQRYGFQSEAVYARGDADVLRRELQAGRPVVVWMTNLASVQPRLIGEAGGERFVLVPQEHAVVVYGYDAERVYIADPGDGQYRSFTWADFMRSWGYFDGMMLRIQPAPWG